MLGAIIGDIVGSVYEWHNIKTKELLLELNRRMPNGTYGGMRGATR